MHNPAVSPLSSSIRRVSSLSIMSMYINIFILLWSISSFSPSSFVEAWPTITLPTTSTNPRNYHLVHTWNTSTGSPTGVATYVSTLPAQWPAPSTGSTSTITTTKFSVTVAAGTGSLSSVLLTLTRSGLTSTDFSLDGTVTSGTRNFITQTDLWATYGAAGAQYVSIIFIPPRHSTPFPAELSFLRRESSFPSYSSSFYFRYNDLLNRYKVVIYN